MDGMVRSIGVADRRIGPGEACFIIAEAGVNHNGDVEIACKLVDAAAEAGADAVKFQTFRAEKLVTMTAPKAVYQKQTTDVSESQFEMLRRLELSEQAHVQLCRYCEQKGLLFLSTPFDPDSADFLQELGVKVFKIPSGEITNPRFLAHVADKGLPMIVSTGMSTLEEVRQAVETIEKQQNQDYVLLHCVSNYPAQPVDVNLRAMATLTSTFQCPVGYSDHTSGVEIAVAAVALGACLVEKHFTLDHTPSPVIGKFTRVKVQRSHWSTVNQVPMQNLVVRDRYIQVRVQIHYLLQKIPFIDVFWLKHFKTRLFCKLF